MERGEVPRVCRVFLVSLELCAQVGCPVGGAIMEHDGRITRTRGRAWLHASEEIASQLDAERFEPLWGLELVEVEGPVQLDAADEQECVRAESAMDLAFACFEDGVGEALLEIAAELWEGGAFDGVDVHAHAKAGDSAGVSEVG